MEASDKALGGCPLGTLWATSIWGRGLARSPSYKGRHLYLQGPQNVDKSQGFGNEGSVLGALGSYPGIIGSQSGIKGTKTRTNLLSRNAFSRKDLIRLLLTLLTELVDKSCRPRRPWPELAATSAESPQEQTSCL